MLTRIANMAGRHPRRVVTLTVLLAVVAGALGGNVASRMGPYGADDPASQSYKASRQLAGATGLETGSDVVALVTPASPATAGRVERILRDDPAIGRVSSYYTTHDRAMLSRDGRSTYVLGALKRGADGDENIDRIRDRLSAVPG